MFVGILLRDPGRDFGVLPVLYSLIKDAVSTNQSVRYMETLLKRYIKNIHSYMQTQFC